ncbi:MAG: hypothetical protein K2Y01_03080 [Rhabdochlamydiaceae bacterium]|nr:hypothetical protein [Rhabdochlamydiaceae bacterium]
MISEEGRIAYVAREINGVLFLGTIERDVGAGGYGSIHEVRLLSTDGAHRTWALKLSGDADEVTEIINGEGITSLHREVSMIHQLNPKGEMSIFPTVHAVVTEKEGSEETLVGYLADLGECNYNRYMTDHPESSFEQIGSEFKDMATSLTFLHRTHMHGDVHDGNFLRTRGSFQLIDYGRARELSTLWNRTDDDACDNYSKLPVTESIRFNDLPGKIEVDIGKLLRRAKKAGDVERVSSLRQERKRLIQECPEEAKAMDVFGLGRVFYLRCYGEEPYTEEALGAEDVAALVLRPQQKQLPPGLKDLIESMLSSNPQERPCMQEVLNHLSVIFPGGKIRSNELWIEEIERFFEPLQKTELLTPKIERLRQVDFFDAPPGLLTKTVRDLILSVLFQLSKEDIALLATQELQYCRQSAGNAMQIDQSVRRVLEGASSFQVERTLLENAPDFMKRVLCASLIRKSDIVQATEVFQTINSEEIKVALQERYRCF